MPRHALSRRLPALCVWGLALVVASRSALGQPPAAASIAGESIRLPDAVVGRPYTASLPLASSAGQVECLVEDGRLPEGLALSGSWIKGTPQRVGSAAFQIRARDEVGQEAAGRFVLEVLQPPAPPLVVANKQVVTVVACVPCHYDLNCSGGYPPYAWRLVSGSLPRGLTLDGPTIAGSVTEVVPDPYTVPLQVAVDDSRGGVASGSVTIEVRPNQAIRLQLGSPSEKESLEVPPAVENRRYSATLPVRGGYGRLEWEVTGQLPEGLEFDQGTLAGTPAKSGTWSFSVTVADEIGQRLSRSCTLDVLPPSPDPVGIVTVALPQAVLGEPWSAFLEAEGGFHPYTWTVQNLPDWAKLERGVIFGLPSHIPTPDAYDLSVRVEDSRGHAAGPVKLSLAVTSNPSLGEPRIVSDRFPTAALGDDYAAALVIEGGRPPYSVNVVEKHLPEGLVLDQDGRLVGRVTQSGNWRVDVQVVDGLGQKSEIKTVVLTIREIAAQSLRMGVLSGLAGVVSREFDFQVPVAGGVLPYTYSLEGDLPQGLQFDTDTGRLAGIPEEAGEWRFTLHVRDSAPRPNQAAGAVTLALLPAFPSRWVTWLGWMAALIAVGAAYVCAFYRDQFGTCFGRGVAWLRGSRP